MDILDGDGDGPYDTYHNAPYTLLRSLRLLRLLRVVPSLVRNDAQLVQRSTPRMLATLLRFNPSVLRLAQLTACLLCSCHWLGCMWWFVGTLECNVYHDPDEVSICEEDGWGPTAELQRVGTDMRGFLEKYNTAFLWGASVMTGFVPFDIEPETPAEVLATTLSLFCGLVMNIITIASAVSVLQSLDHKWGQINERLSNVNEFLVEQEAPRELSGAVLEFCAYKMSSNQQSLQVCVQISTDAAGSRIHPRIHPRTHPRIQPYTHPHTHPYTHPDKLIHTLTHTLTHTLMRTPPGAGRLQGSSHTPGDAT